MFFLCCTISVFILTPLGLCSNNSTIAFSRVSNSYNKERVEYHENRVCHQYELLYRLWDELTQNEKFYLCVYAIFQPAFPWENNLRHNNQNLRTSCNERIRSKYNEEAIFISVAFSIVINFLYKYNLPYVPHKENRWKTLMHACHFSDSSTFFSFP